MVKKIYILGIVIAALVLMGAQYSAVAQESTETPTTEPFATPISATSEMDTPMATSTSTVTTTDTDTPAPTVEDTPTLTETESPTATIESTGTPTATETNMPTPTATGSPTVTPEPARPSLVLPAVSPDDPNNVTIAYHDGTGKTRFLAPAKEGRTLAQPSAVDAAASPEFGARNFLAAYGDLFGLKDQGRELALMKANDMDDGRLSVRFQQTYQGIPVLAGEIIVNLDAAKNVLSVSGEILPDIKVYTTPAIDAAAAQQMAIEATAKEQGVAPSSLTASKPELWVYNPVLLVPWSGPTVLTWRIEVTAIGLGPIRQLVLVDAQHGGITLSFNQVDTAKNRETYTANNGTSLPGTLVCNESDPNCTGGDSDAVAAHIYAGDTYDFYLNYHSRDSINNAGMTMKSSVHYNSGYCNAFWNGSQMVYGDGCSIVADDVVGHELTHGVTQYESNLFYYYQSGAINESFSDVWGEFMDLTNGKGNDTSGIRWLMGEDTSMGAIRNMQNPPAFSDPDKITSSYYYTGTNDNGGVHTNSGVNNKAAYLMTDGGSFNGQTVNGLGITKAAKIYYEAQTNLLTSGADYTDLYNALYQACFNLIGVAGINSNDCQQVRNAALAVEMNQQPVAGFNLDAEICPAGKSPLNTFFDDFESGFTNWTLGAISGTNFWTTTDPWGPNAHSGAHDLYADDYYTSSNAYARMTNAVTIPANAYLYFYHTFDLESGWDGGVIEYSTDGTNWMDGSSLIDSGQNYVGSVSALGRTGFTGPSHGYVSTRLNLSSLSGQNVRFRWRMATDASVYVWGWWLDDVRIYTCVSALTISGDAGMEGVTLSYTDGVAKTSTSDNNGNYSFTVSNGWSGSVTPSHACYTFDPASRTYSNITTNQTAQNYTPTSDPTSGCADVDVTVGGNLMGSYWIPPQGSTRQSFTELVSGPVKVVSTNSLPIIAAERSVYMVNGAPVSNNEMMGLPAGQLSTTYWMPWYNNVNMYTQLRFGNVSGSPASVHVYIGGVEMSGSPFALTASGAGQSMRVSFAGVDNGPVKVVSDVPIVAAERSVYMVNGAPVSNNEMMGLPAGQLSTTYWMPWYNNVNMYTQLRFGVP